MVEILEFKSIGVFSIKKLNTYLLLVSYAKNNGFF